MKQTNKAKNKKTDRLTKQICEFKSRTKEQKTRRIKTGWNNCCRWRSNRGSKAIRTKCKNKCKYTSKCYQ